MFSKSLCFSAKKTFSFFAIFGLLLPWSAWGGATSSVPSSGSPIFSNGSFNSIYLPLSIKCAGCQNLIGNWKINTPDETHTATFLTNGIWSILFQGETTAQYGNYTCTAGQFEGLVVVGTFSLKVTGALTCDGSDMNGTWEIKINGNVIDSGNFSGLKL